ncbi:hypothetical protein [Verrucomicrobium sp. GAS474]|uniref:hypothetical protein n=1 Tax=Verrucomicrobium sp. GAS474 TaxID=1882831 RepID=UPI0012FFCD80|nr:hypothetical protein [Verrucomicrobium sp. GAS474]
MIFRQDNSMTWSRLLDLLGEALDSAPDFAHTEDDLTDILLSAEGALEEFDDAAAEGVRAAVRTYARTGEWPELTAEEQTCLRYRLSIAGDYAAFVAEASKNPLLHIGQPEMEEEDLFEWVLCAMWRDYGFPLLRDLIESFARGREGIGDEDTPPGGEEGDAFGEEDEDETN